MRLNTAYDLGWRSNLGTPIDDAHLLAIDVPAGRHHLEVRYWPRRLTLGLWISVLGLLGSITFLVRHTGRTVLARIRGRFRRDTRAPVSG